jgi:hypothetical protein
MYSVSVFEHANAFLGLGDMPRRIADTLTETWLGINAEKFGSFSMGNIQHYAELISITRSAGSRE